MKRAEIVALIQEYAGNNYLISNKRTLTDIQQALEDHKVKYGITEHEHEFQLAFWAEGMPRIVHLTKDRDLR